MCPVVVLLILFYLLSEMLPGFSSAHLTSILFFFFKCSLYPYLLSVSLLGCWSSPFSVEHSSSFLELLSLLKGLVAGYRVQG